MYRESQEIQDDAWDCTLIKNMKERNDTIVNPIYFWTLDDIWKYIKTEKIEVNFMYERGYLRVGCIGCPLANYTQRTLEFTDYPKFKDNYILAFEQMLKVRKANNKDTKWKNGKEVFDWWIEENKHQVKGQISFDDFMNGGY